MTKYISNLIYPHDSHGCPQLLQAPENCTFLSKPSVMGDESARKSAFVTLPASFWQSVHDYAMNLHS